MKKIVQTKNQYYYLCIPQFVFFIFIIYCSKLYFKSKNTIYLDIRKTPLSNISFIFPAVVEFLLYGVAVGAVPAFISSCISWNNDIAKMFFDIHSYNFASILFGIYLIKKQEKMDKTDL